MGDGPSTTITLQPESVAQILYQVGFRQPDLVTMLAIGKRESGYTATAWRSENKPKDTGDFGLFQINYTADTPAAKLAVGYKKRNPDWFNPVTNARMAFYMYTLSGFGPWKASGNGYSPNGDPTYGTDIKEAQRVYDNAVKLGYIGKPFDDSGTWSPDQATPTIGDYVGVTVDATTGAVSNTINSVTDFLKLLADPNTWLRVAKVVGGILVALIGLNALFEETPTGQAIKQAVGKYATVAA